MPTILTNKYGLPDSIVKAVEYDTHKSPADISTTTLIDAPQIRLLKRAHTFEEDVMDRIWALYGTAMHHILERAEIKDANASKLIQASGILEQLAHDNNDPQMKAAAGYIEKLAMSKFPGAFNDDVIYEQTLVIEVDGMSISGTFDRAIKSEKKIQDYKNTSVYEWIYPEAQKKRRAQLNIYAAMCRIHDIPIEKGELIYIFRDWNKSESKKPNANRDYPNTPVKLVDCPLLPHEQVMEYIKARVRVHKAAESGERVDCTPKERWSEASTYAVKVPGKQRALPGSISPTKELAEAFIKTNAQKHQGAYVETRNGDDKRCNEFCPVRDVCPQRKEILEEKANQEM